MATGNLEKLAGGQGYDADYFSLIGEESPSRLLLIGHDGGHQTCEVLVQRCHISMVARVSYEDAAAHLDRMALVDIVWIIGADGIEDADLADLRAAILSRGCSLLCESSLAGLDRMVANFEGVDRAEYVVEGDDTDRVMALAALRKNSGTVVHDVTRDSSSERIERLQEEVARISRILGELAGPRECDFVTPHYTMQADDKLTLSTHVRAPVRDFAAGPRSFVPGERAVMQRNKAKRVRRILRERRMREQFFPADLFADPAWDMLLDLYAARLEDQPVAVSSLCIAAAVPATTALRWIKTMTESGMFVREADPQDGRRIFIALGDGAAEALDRYFEALDD